MNSPVTNPIAALGGESVPFADLHQQYLSLKDRIDAAIAEVIAQSAFIRGPFVDAFEAEFARAMGAKHCVSCANGTDSLYLAMKALGVGPGDEVIVPAMTWVSTSSTVTLTGARVVFCDIDPVTRTMDPAGLEAGITGSTVGIIPVHLYGHPAPMGDIMRIARANGLWVVEDCAQAHLAECEGRLIGSFGNAASFSFYPGKNLGAMGDAGAVTTNDADLAVRMAKIARNGGLKKGDHEVEGVNSRLDGLQAAILSVKLPHLPAWTKARRAAAHAYGTALSGLSGLSLPQEAAGFKHVWHLYVLRSDRRDALQQHLKAAGVETSIYYPRAIPFLPCYADRGHRSEDFPEAAALAMTNLALPMFAEITPAQIERVVKAVQEFHRSV